MSQDNIDSSFRQLLDDHYPFIEQGAEPPGRFQQYRNGPGQTWSGKSGWRTRHGDAVVMWSLGRPNRVWSARLADGTAIEAMATLGSPIAVALSIGWRAPPMGAWDCRDRS
jgi:hypothetical protein